MLKLLKYLKHLFFFMIGLMVVYLLLLPVRYYKYRSGPVITSLDLPALTGYTNEPSVTSGDSLLLYVHATGDFEGRVYRFGEEETTVFSFSETAQPQSNRYSSRYGHDWSVTNVLPTAGWPAGYYLIELRLVDRPENVFNIPVLVGTERDGPLVVVAPTNTWHAYNTYGGRSNYKDLITPADLRYVFLLLRRAGMDGLAPFTYLPQRRPYNHPISHRVPDRPQDYAGGKITSDLYLPSFLQNEAIPFDVISDRDFTRGRKLSAAKTVIFHNHSEYWSHAGIGRVRQLLDRGVNIIFLSGNNMYRGVEWIKGETMLVSEQIIHREVVEPTLGTYYSESGYEEAMTPFRVDVPDHWVFDGTNLATADTFGGPAASGVETDKLGAFGEGFLLLATGTNRTGPAHMVIKEFSAGNFLFNTSSVSSVTGLAESEAFRQMVRNLIQRGGQPEEVKSINKITRVN